MGASFPSIVTVKKSDTVSQALQVLREKNFTSLGVTDDEGDCFVGLLAAYDLMAWICLGVYKDGSSTASSTLDKPVGDVTGVFHAETNRIWSFEENAPLRQALEPLSKGVHRAVVVMADGTFRLISQLDVIQFASQQSWDQASKSLEEVGIGKNSVCSVNADETALSALRKMERENFTSLPVVNKDGAVVSTISAEDVRHLSVDSLNQVEKNADEFIKSIHSGELPSPLTFTVRQSLAEVMKQMIDSNQRHGWIVDSNNTPVSSVSFSDIIGQM